MAENGGEEEQRDDELDDDEDVLALRDGPRQLSDGRHRQRAPVERVQVLREDVRIVGRLQPAVIAVSLLVDDAQQAGIPVVDHEQVVQQGDGAHGVRIVGVPLGAVEERPQAVDLDEPEAAQHRLVADGEVEDVERQQAEAVDVEDGRVHVVQAQLRYVRLQHAFLQEAGAEAERDVEHIQ